jgi:hypothetical protein
MRVAWLLILVCAAAGPSPSLSPLTDRAGNPLLPPRETGKWSAIETRPLWERPSMGLTLQEQTEAALDRGNGRIEDQPTFDLRQLEREQMLWSSSQAWGEWSRANFEQFETLWERQRAVERAEQKSQADQQRQLRLERESETLAAERERWLRQSLQPRHGEAAVLDRQALEHAESEYQSSLQTAGAIRDSAIKTITGSGQLSATEKSAQQALVQERYAQRLRAADLRRQQSREMILGSKQ